MRRRAFLAALVGTAAMAARVGVAQNTVSHARVGWLAHGDTMPRHFFDEALVRLGWIEGKNLTIERRFSGAAGQEQDKAADQLVAWAPDVIVALGTVDAYPILALTRSIPIVVVTSTDPVRQGLAASLARPGGNVTGTAAINIEIFPKLLELVHELLPNGGRVSVLGDPTNPGHVPPPPRLPKPWVRLLSVMQADPRNLIRHAFAAAAADGDRAMVVQFSAVSFEERWRVTALAAWFKIPTIYPVREYAEAGGLVSYGAALRDNFERAAVLVDKILHGAHPGDLPIEQPTRLELVLNLKTAKELGLIVPQSLLTRADEVIE